VSEKERGWRVWLGPVIAFVVLSLMVVGAVIAVDVYRWKGSDVGWLLVGLIALGVMNFGTMLEGIPALGWIVMITGGVVVEDSRYPRGVGETPEEVSRRPDHGDSREE
jgi:hypothetical protein